MMGKNKQRKIPQKNQQKKSEQEPDKDRRNHIKIKGKAHNN